MTGQFSPGKNDFDASTLGVNRQELDPEGVCARNRVVASLGDELGQVEPGQDPLVDAAPIRVEQVNANALRSPGERGTNRLGRIWGRRDFAKM